MTIILWNIFNMYDSGREGITLEKCEIWKCNITAVISATDNYLTIMAGNDGSVVFIIYLTYGTISVLQTEY